MKIFNKSEWKKVKLVDVCEIITGNTPLKKEKEYWDKDEVPFITPPELKYEGINYITPNIYVSKIGAKQGRIIPKNSICVCCIGSLGKLGILKEDAITNQQINSLILKNKNVDLLYLYFYLKTIKNNLESIASSTTVKIINKSSFEKIEISLPNLEIQKKISKKLELLENNIDFRKNQLNYLKELNKSLFTRMFGDIKTNDKNWKIVKLEKYINIIGGYAFKNIDFKSSGIPLIRIGNINSGQFKSTNLVFIEENKKFEKFKVFPNDILISLTGTVGKDDYGNACILGDSYSEYYLNQRNAKIELTDKMNKNFFLEIMKIKEVKKKLTGISRGIRQANISNKDIYNLSLPLPPIELQNKFAERVEKIEKLKFIKRISLFPKENKEVVA
ncbi:restriction endonuclease subunit S [Fusobacterium polymorphum]|uniref:Possible type I site-specific deoxyribonuclease specificity subunit n=1 Tax=Fusobacterium polymorphum ATCC 10953 TaxID=393480 RepID=A5TW21_FUSNP|nr:restriction endonuclease subunit S [Fusobacterium polymorphum]EDK89096.1 possible type I site-specific deoxyribonuclease specificity subunit [Fusobacterium polymorphum ATCC 10953]WRL69070.1 restriction endonuclease subunit S [Fusobacterium polymorphum]